MLTKKLSSFANTSGNSLEDDRILIGFADDSYVKLDIDGFTRSALKRFILLLNTYRPDIKIRSDFSDLLSEAEDRQEMKEELLDAVSSQPRERRIRQRDALSFTKIWESELRSRYSTTAYTPLEFGDELQISEDRRRGSSRAAVQAYSGLLRQPDAKRNLRISKPTLRY